MRFTFTFSSLFVAILIDGAATARALLEDCHTNQVKIVAHSAAAVSAVRESARQAGWEDVLWVLFLSPEFQFIR